MTRFIKNFLINYQAEHFPLSVLLCVMFLLLPPSTASVEAQEVEEQIFGSVEWMPGSLEGRVYNLPDKNRVLPDFSSLTPTAKVYSQTLNIPERAWSEGFPGVTDLYEWFAVDYHGRFFVKKAGRYTFRLISDDGSKLYIDNRLVVDNDGTHATTSKSGTVSLSSGIHKINVAYFQGPRFHIALQLFISEENGQEFPFPSKDISLVTPPEIRFMRPTKGGYQPMIEVEYTEPFFVELHYDNPPVEDSMTVGISFDPKSDTTDVTLKRTEENSALFRSKALAITGLKEGDK